MVKLPICCLVNPYKLCSHCGWSICRDHRFRNEYFGHKSHYNIIHAQQSPDCLYKNSKDFLTYAS